MSVITKFTILLSVLFLAIFFGFFYFIFGYSEENLKNQIFDELVIIAELEEGYLLTFLEHAKGRAVDFSSDGLIRNYTQQIVSTAKNSEATKLLNEHLIKNKKGVDPTIRGIFITDIGGKIIAATDDNEIGRDESGDNYFKNIKNQSLIYGSSFVSDVYVSYHFGTSNPVFLVGSPLFSVDQKEKIGFIINQISLEEISKILSGEKSEELGSISGIGGRRSTFDTYIVNRDNLLITPSIHENEGLLKQKIETTLTEGCETKDERTALYKNFSGEDVLGSSMCLPVHNWTLVTELSESEAFAVINAFRRDALIFSVIFLLVLIGISVFFLYYFIIKNILLLRRGVQIVGGGNLDHKIKITSNDELSDLANDFNSMTMQLKELISDLKESSIKIKESEEKYKTIFNGAADAVLISDLEGDFKEANNKSVALTGYSEAELLKMSHLQLYAKDYMARCQEQFRVAIQKKYCFEENINILKKNGSVIPADVTINMFEYGGKQFLQFIIRDVSERVALQKHHDEIDHLKSQFINVVSHQLRTPLNSVRWNLEVLLGGDLGKMKSEQENFLKTIYLNNQNIINIISDLFLALEIEEGNIALEKEIVNLDTLVNNNIEGLRNNIKIKKLKINFKKPNKGKIVNVEADSNKLSQVITRLIDNAIKYTNEGGEITVKIEIVDGKVVVSVADNGIGIPQKDQEVIFSKFFRASNAAVMYPNASGLGLFISQKIVEAHGGHIWFESKEGVGTAFFVSLPSVK